VIYAEHRKPKRRFLKFAIFIAVIIGAYYLINNFPLEAAPKILESKTINSEPAEIEWPEYGSGAVGMLGGDGILSSYGAETPKPIASITKIITALVVLEEKPIEYGTEGPSIDITNADLEIYNQQVAAGAASKQVAVGGSMSEKQMISAMILPSAANYSISLANWAYGSVDAYVAAANTWLEVHDFNDTKVVDTSGLLPGNVSTSSELIRIGELVMKNKTLAAIVGLKESTIPGVGNVNNSNSLIGTMGVNGIKTGMTGDAGTCILFSSVYETNGRNQTIIGALLGADDRKQQNDDVKRVLEGVRSGFKSVQVASKGQVFANYQNIFGQNKKLVAAKDISVTAWSDTPVEIKVRIDKISLLDLGNIKGELIVENSWNISHHPLVSK
jgi:serine-type D-Ala-D-Ala carboxypeptidase (penicillin-binding protein 5/6)